MSSRGPNWQNINCFVVESVWSGQRTWSKQMLQINHTSTGPGVGFLNFGKICFYFFIIIGRHKKVLNCLETKVFKVNQLEQIYFSLFAYNILGALKIPSKAACSHWSAQNIARLLLFQKKKNGKYEMSKTLVFCIIYPIGF